MEQKNQNVNYNMFSDLTLTFVFSESSNSPEKSSRHNDFRRFLSRRLWPRSTWEEPIRNFKRPERNRSVEYNTRRFYNQPLLRLLKLTRKTHPILGSRQKFQRVLRCNLWPRITVGVNPNAVIKGKKTFFL